MKLSKMFDRVSCLSSNWYVRTATMIVLYEIFSRYCKEMKGNYWYHLSGSASWLGASGLDYLSSISWIKLIDENQSRMSCLRRTYEETNPVLGKHPTTSQFSIRIGILTAMVLPVCTYAPPLAYAYCCILPFILRNNKIVYKNLKQDLEALTE